LSYEKFPPGRQVSQMWLTLMVTVEIGVIPSSQARNLGRGLPPHSRPFASLKVTTERWGRRRRDD
jgi:hypothetical protein